MTFRRALVLAPLAVCVAIAAHFLGFGGSHALGGSHGAEFLAVGVGGSVLLAVSAVLWLAVTECDGRRGELSLLRLLPGRGALPAAALTLASSGFVAFAAGEVIEGRSPLGTWTTALSLALVATAIAACARRLAGWLAAGGAALAQLFSTPVGAAPRPCLAAVGYSKPLARTTFGRGTRRGRAPPQIL